MKLFCYLREMESDERLVAAFTRSPLSTQTVVELGFALHPVAVSCVVIESMPAHVITQPEGGLA